MRPPDLPGGNPLHGYHGAYCATWASMRPPDLPGGNTGARTHGRARSIAASMRPPDLPGGNRNEINGEISAVIELQ